MMALGWSWKEVQWRMVVIEGVAVSIDQEEVGLP